MIEKVNILLVDDQPAKLLSYEAILGELGENLVKASSAREALESLLKVEIAVILVDVCMPELDGFQLAAMIRDHPRFQKIAIIFVSAIHLADVDFLRGYEMGAVDYVPVPVVPQLLRAKVKVFAELYRKTRQLEKLNTELETRVAERTAELEASTRRLLESEQLRSLALAAGQMGTWNWDAATSEIEWDEGEYRIFGVDPRTFKPSPESIRGLIHPEDWDRLAAVLARVDDDTQSLQTEFRVKRPNGELRWCIGTAVARLDADKRILHVCGVTTDVTERKEAEERQNLLAREVDHRARNALAVVQSIVRLSRESSVESYVAAVEGRINALARAHMLLSEFRWQGAHLARLVREELAPYQSNESEKVVIAGPDVLLQPSTAQTLALALHELATNAAKHGALSLPSVGGISFTWELQPSSLVLQWNETGGPPVRQPQSQGYGIRIIAASVERQLGGQVVFDWRPEGLVCTLSIPRREKMETFERVTAGRRSSEREQVRKLAGFAGNRILIAEDEALVAMMMRDVLADLGFCVIGPLGTAGEALDAARRDHVDAAILDVNLGGELIYPVADALAARGVPFAFVTGYGVESIDDRFAHVPVLQKPIAPRVLGDLFSAAANGKMNGGHEVALDNFVRTGSGARTPLY
jgi:PAS domain S-box-containing protein